MYRQPGEREEPQRIAIALGGGTARGMVHVGVLKALDDLGVRPTMLGGTSFGAVIATLYALCGNAYELERVVRTQDIGEVWRQGLDFGLHRGAIVHGERLRDWLDRKFFFGATFEDLPMPLAIATTDLATGELVVVASGSLADAVRASCALPGLFAPVRWRDRWLIDGGFVEPVPFSTLTGVGVRKLGVHAGVDVRSSSVVRAIRRFNTTPFGRAFLARGERVTPRGPIGQIYRGLAISLGSYSRGLKVPPDARLLRVEPHISWWDFHKSPAAIDAGETAMRELIASGFLMAPTAVALP
ncbi:MAG TPA: patatin-like phospholipase family protein [Trueperaceae bacterium]|nr:patatin-like phospholipase family protein [Trueperaceae bacterium]